MSRPKKYGVRLLHRRARDERVYIRVPAYEKERWRRAAPSGNISAWLRALATKELLLQRKNRNVKQVKY